MAERSDHPAAQLIEDDLDLTSQLTDRTCNVCGRSQSELQRIGHSLRFLCPDEVCTSCLGESAAAA